MKSKQDPQQINLINIVETISRSSAKSQLNLEKLVESRNEIDILSGFLKVSPIQAVLFSTILEMSLVKRTNMESLARHFKISLLSLIGRMEEIEVLSTRGLIRKNTRSGNETGSFNSVYYKIPDRVIEGIQKMDKSKILQKSVFDLPKFLERIYQLAGECERRIITTRQLIQDTEALIKSNPKLEYINFVKDQLLNPMDRCIVFVLSYLHLLGRSEVDLSEFAEDIFDDISDQFAFHQEMVQGKHSLLKKEFIELGRTEFGDVRIMKISEKAISTLFQKQNDLPLQNLKSGSLIEPASLKRRMLYFNSDQETDIINLGRTLSQKKFNTIRRQLEKRNFNSGITVLLYGESGTGKTELVYQLARKTNREIMMVDLSQARSKWFGESEKQVKKIFDDYRRVIHNIKKCPILFINEVDGLLSTRQSVGSGDTSSQHANNIIQNILLQELESFEGILLATTNLTENLDKAFDRRFLFKLRFTHPDPESRFKIWKCKMPELPVSQLRELSKNFELTGGQIDNIVKQTLLIQMVEDLDLYETLQKNCRMENGYRKTNTVGF